LVRPLGDLPRSFTEREMRRASAGSHPWLHPVAMADVG
jgi:hypothetical protein